MSASQFDTCGELVIQRFGQGIKLLRPEQANPFKKPVTVSQLLAMPCHVYFMDTQSVVKNINERTVISFNLRSTTDSIGITVRDVAEKKSAERSLMFDRQVVNNDNFVIEDEIYTRLDGISFPMLSIKFPWYEVNTHKLIGIFGFSIMLDKTWGCSVSDTMKMLIETGLLQSISMVRLP